MKAKQNWKATCKCGHRLGTHRKHWRWIEDRQGEESACWGRMCPKCGQWVYLGYAKIKNPPAMTTGKRTP